MRKLKHIFSTIILILLLTSNSYSAGSGGSGDGDGGKKVNKNSLEYKGKANYSKAVKLINKAKKLEKKNKIEKENKNYKNALDHLTTSFTINPNDPDVLNYMGFATRKLGDFENAETYYLMGLKINPNHNGINEYLGELYIQTNRIDKAKERLSVLKNCNCEEYTELKEIIEGKKSSKY